MPAYVSLPSVALPEHRVSTEEIVVDLERAGAGRRDLAAAVRIVWALGVDTRYVSRSLARLGEAEEIADRNRWTVEAVYRLGEEAARRALKAARLEAGEVGALVAVHSSGIAMPGLGVHLSRALGLRADVLHVPVTQVGCAGGAWGLALAADLVAARPGRRVLVVVSEALSGNYRPAEPGQVAAMYRGLFADGAAASVVSSDPRGPGLRIEESWTYLLPDSSTAYWMDVTSDGQHFDSTPAALHAVAGCMPPLVDWLKARGPRAWPVWVAAHPGGPRIINSVADGMPECPDLRHAWASLREHGNPGGPAVLDVLRRFHQEPPADGAPGMLCGFGPGFAAAAVSGRWGP
ncbi:PhlD [Streptomyces olivaceus]|uniref:PhlD n=1 Tax=Streptomyces olivaceus TaxID=47716 RepID=UPI001CCD934A|nr:PhlD [Streptomyces olivaceus]MBZ6212048.1 PhlD [Streptomyces olivaceus]